MILDKASRKYYNEYVKKAYVNRVKFKKINKKHFKYGELDVGGLFFETEGDYAAEMHVAVGHPFEKWFPVFVHETSHMDQFLENSIYWRKVEESCGQHSIEVLDNIVDHGTAYPKNLVECAIRAVVGVEWDCERRVLHKIKKYALPIDAKEYMQRANACLFVFPMLAYTNRWPLTDQLPYENEKILDTMPTKLLPLRTYYEIPEKYKNLYLENCYD